MIQAFCLAQEVNPNLELLAIANHSVTKELPLPDGAEFVEDAPQNELKNLYARCDAWLFGSRFEGFGLPILEALACRTPVIATPAGAAPEILTKGGGILVPQEDTTAMAEAIIRISSMDETEWQALSQTAYQSVLGYTWNDAAIRFEAALKEALAHGSRKGQSIKSR